MGRSPHGERGLKSGDTFTVDTSKVSLPSRGAWIEISRNRPNGPGTRSLPSRGAWIEIIRDPKDVKRFVGRSPHGERGLKCFVASHDRLSAVVAPLTGSVD